MGSDATCRSCDYYRFALKYNEMDLDNRETHFSERTIAYADATDFQQGEVLTKILPAPPRLVESFDHDNIVLYDHRYFGIPKAAGPVHVDSEAILRVEGLIVDASLGRVRTAIKQRMRRAINDRGMAEAAE